MTFALQTLCVTLLAALATLATAAPTHAVLRATQSDAAVYRSGIDDAGAARAFDLLSDVDADAQRISLRWGRLAQGCGALTTEQRRDPDAPGCYDWTLIDHAVRATAPREVYFSVREPPCWLFAQPECQGEGAGNGFVGSTPQELERFQTELTAFVTAAATRYSGRPGREPLVRNWTIWNEPNGAFFWSERRGAAASGPDAIVGSEPPIAARGCHFAHVYAGVVRDLRANVALPPLRFGLGPLAPSSAKQPMAFLDAALAVGADQPPFVCGDGDARLITEDLVDAVGVHPYPSSPRAEPYGPCASWQPDRPLAARGISLQCIDEFRRAIDADGGGERYAAVAGKPLWALETGYENAAADPVNGVPALTQAAWYPQVLQRLEGAGAEVVSWYAAVDGGDPGDWQSGLVAANTWTRRPLALTFQAPVALRAVDGAGWEVWAAVSEGVDATLLISTRCDHDARDGYEFRELPSDRGAGTRLARLAPGMPSEFCVTIGRGPSNDPALGVVAGVRIVDGAPTSYLVTARVVEDAWLDPRGDVVDSLAPASTGNPTIAAVLRRALLGSREPTRIDPTRRSLALR